MFNLLSGITGLVINSTEEVYRSTTQDSSFQFFMLFFLIMILIIVILVIAVYIYSSLAYMALARKTKTEHAWLAWIPIANLYLMSKMAKMHWWPILLAIPGWIGLIFFFILLKSFLILSVLFLLIAIIFSIIFMVFWFMWHWKIYERVGKPGWWILLLLIPYVGGILYIIFLGIAAWSKD